MSGCGACSHVQVCEYCLLIVGFMQVSPNPRSPTLLLIQYGMVMLTTLDVTTLITFHRNQSKIGIYQTSSLQIQILLQLKLIYHHLHKFVLLLFAILLMYLDLLIVLHPCIKLERGECDNYEYSR